MGKQKHRTRNLQVGATSLMVDAQTFVRSMGYFS